MKHIETKKSLKELLKEECERRYWKFDLVMKVVREKVIEGYSEEKAIQWALSQINN
jgi:hypothetical protein